MADPPSPGAPPGRPPRGPDPSPDDPAVPRETAPPVAHDLADQTPSSEPALPVSLFGDPPDDALASASNPDYEGIGSASRSCLVILLLATAIVVLICASTVIRALT